MWTSAPTAPLVAPCDRFRRCRQPVDGGESSAEFPRDMSRLPHSPTFAARGLLCAQLLPRVLNPLAERRDRAPSVAPPCPHCGSRCEWSRPPNAWPISTSCICSSSRARYIAICRGTVSVLMRALERSPSGVTPQRRATTSCTLSIDRQRLRRCRRPSSPGRILSASASRASSIEISRCLSEAKSSSLMMQPSSSRTFDRTCSAMKRSTSSGIVSSRWSCSCFFRRMAIRCSRSGWPMSATMPHSNRLTRRASRPGISLGGRSEVRTICLLAS